MSAVLNKNSPEIIETLIKAGADINAVTARGDTALMTVFLDYMPYMKPPATENMEKAVMKLLDNGADVSVRNNDGKTALDLANELANFKNTEAYKRLV
jgi:ankyrin repeat protein